MGVSTTDSSFRHVVEYGDVWMPIDGRWPIVPEWTRLQQVATDAGRDPATLQLGVFGARPENLPAFRDGGASFVALGLPPLDRDAALDALDRYASLVEEYHSE
jgi:hypothetical protein